MEERPPFWRPARPGAAIEPLEGGDLRRSRTLAAGFSRDAAAQLRHAVGEDPRLALGEGEVVSLAELLEQATLTFDAGGVEAYERYYELQGFELPPDWPPPLEQGSAYADLFRLRKVGFVSAAGSKPRLEVQILAVAGTETERRSAPKPPGAITTTGYIGEDSLRGPHDIADPTAAGAHMVMISYLGTRIRVGSDRERFATGTTNLYFVKRPADSRWLLWKFEDVYPRDSGWSGLVRF